MQLSVAGMCLLGSVGPNIATKGTRMAAAICIGAESEVTNTLQRPIKAANSKTTQNNFWMKF